VNIKNTITYKLKQKMKIGILSYGVGNLGSIKRMLEKAGGKVAFITEPCEMTGVEKLLLPGVGHFAEGVRALKNSGLWGPLVTRAQDSSTPIMGICLGMQLLCQHSEEGDILGLGIVDANVRKFSFSNDSELKVPHMGWNTLRTVRSNPIVPMDEKEQRFYFVHSYKVVPNNSEIAIANCDYGGEFCAAFQHGDVYGVQFHPEKSHRFGMELMKRFVEL
jgi:imidazole glycerol-phosphate synthase subunit HisH